MTPGVLLLWGNPYAPWESQLHCGAGFYPQAEIPTKAGLAGASQEHLG